MTPLTQIFLGNFLALVLVILLMGKLRKLLAGPRKLLMWVTGAPRKCVAAPRRRLIRRRCSKKKGWGRQVRVMGNKRATTWKPKHKCGAAPLSTPAAALAMTSASPILTSSTRGMAA